MHAHFGKEKAVLELRCSMCAGNKSHVTPAIAEVLQAVTTHVQRYTGDTAENVSRCFWHPRYFTRRRPGLCVCQATRCFAPCDTSIELVT